MTLEQKINSFKQSPPISFRYNLLKFEKAAYAGLAIPQLTKLLDHKQEIKEHVLNQLRTLTPGHSHKPVVTSAAQAYGILATRYTLIVNSLITHPYYDVFFDIACITKHPTVLEAYHASLPNIERCVATDMRSGFNYLYYAINRYRERTATSQVYF